MKNVLFTIMVSLMMASCTNNEIKEVASSTKDAEAKVLYEKNLATVQAFVAAFEKEDSTGLASLVADTARWASPAYGDTLATKAHWIESLKYYMNNWSNLHLSNGNFLPGIDSASHEFDGSIRYYGRWDGVHSSGITTRVNFYGTYDFNKDNKIVFGAEYFDLGGMMNALRPTAK